LKKDLEFLTGKTELTPLVDRVNSSEK
jgi:hypothetical protein